MGQKYAVPVAKFADPARAQAQIPPPPPPRAARPILVHPNSSPVQVTIDDEADGLWERMNLDALPSWLTSMVFHMSLLLMLALIASGGTGNGGPGNTVYYDAQIGGDDSDGTGDVLLEGGDLLKQVEQAVVAEQPATPPNEVPPLVDFSTMLAAATPMELTAPSIQSLGTGLGTGGHGKGSGGGDGDDHGRGGSGDGLLGPIKTGMFELFSEGSSFVYVFDRSGSMNSALQYTSPEGDTVLSATPLVAAKAELIKSLRDLTPKQQFHVLFYNHQVTPFNTGRSALKPISATRENIYKVESFVQSVQAFGKTYHIEPMEMALKMKPDVIFLLTDGEEQDDPSEGQLEYLNKLNAGYRTKINVIQIGFEPRPGCTLERLAKENRGKHRFLNIADLLPAIAKMTN